FLGQNSIDVIDFQVPDGLVKVYGAILHVFPIEHGQYAFPAGGDITVLDHIPVLVDDLPFVDDDQPGDMGAVNNVLVEFLEAFDIPVFGNIVLVIGPTFPGKNLSHHGDHGGDNQ